QPAADAAAIEDAIRAGVRDAIVTRGEPAGTDIAGVAALESLGARRLLAPLALARASGVSELEQFLDHFRSALADGRRSGITRLTLDGANAEHRAETTLYALAEPVDTTPLDDRVEWAVWGLLSSARDVETRALLADLLTEAERAAGVAQLTRQTADALEYVDVLWHDRARMVFCWQLEWTARLHRSVAGIGESIPDEDRVFRFLAIADERRPLA